MQDPRKQRLHPGSPAASVPQEGPPATLSLRFLPRTRAPGGNGKARMMPPTRPSTWDRATSEEFCSQPGHRWAPGGGHAQPPPPTVPALGNQAWVQT